jgi:type IV pilus assembly protein PilC
VIIEQAQNPILKKNMALVQQDLLSGSSLTQSLEKREGVFPAIFISMLKAGESSGKVPEALEQLCSYMEKEQEINQKIKSAVLYPATICLVSIIMVFLIITLVLPSFLEIYQFSDLSLPGPTLLLLKLGELLSRHLVWFILLMAGILATIYRMAGIPKYKLLFSRLILRIPVVGQAIAGISTARFARSMGSLVQAGVPVLRGLEITEGIVGNSVVSQALQDAGRRISVGASITAPFKEAGVFSPIVVQMIATGEETGTLDIMLVQLADYYEKEVFHLISNLLAILEPLLIVLMAVMVGAIVIAVLLPILNMMEILQ